MPIFTSNQIKASEIVSKIDELSVTEGIYQDGDILMVHSRRDRALSQSKLDTEHFLMENLISEYSHAAQIITDEWSGEVNMSHIFGEYEYDAVKGQDLGSADVFRIDPSKLVSEENAKILDQHLFISRKKTGKKSSLQNITISNMTYTKMLKRGLRKYLMIQIVALKLGWQNMD